MGWKASMIIVNSDKQVNELELLTNLGFQKLKETKSESFEAVHNPKEGKVYVGHYNGNLLICVQDLPATFLAEKVTEQEKVLFNYFGDAEVCALDLHSGVNYWGYSISKNNKKLRARSGSSEEGTTLEYGEPLEQELSLLAKSVLDENGNRVYHLEELPDESFAEDQVGENFVFSLASRYFGENLDMADDALFETQMKGYEFSSSSVKPRKASKNWPKYVIVIVVVIIWQLLKRTVFKD